MTDSSQQKMNAIPGIKPEPRVDYVTELSPGDLHDLCDATDAAIEAGGGFGWIKLPARDILERYWKGVLTMPARMLFVARLDGVICGTAQLITPPRNNEAQSFAVTLTTNFVAPWARGHGLARMLVEQVEIKALAEGYAVINLDVRETLEAAVKLYESMGYIHYGTHPYYARVGDQIIKGRHYYKVIDKTTMPRL
jgi:ribosomal protein S18 acetylase RimI-like enzyme